MVCWLSCDTELQVAKGKAYTAALFNLINVTAGIVHEQQSALYAVMRGPL